MGSKNKHKILLEHRSPEVQQKTGKIPGRLLGWGITIISLFFIGLLFIGTKITFDRETKLKAQLSGKGQLFLNIPSEHLIEPNDILSLNWKGIECEVQASAVEKAGVLVQLPQHNTSFVIPNNDTIAVILRENYSLLEIVFSDLKKSFVR